LAPDATAIWFSPDGSTVMSATPVATPGTRTTPETSIANDRRPSSASAPMSSSPTAPTNRVGAPKRAAAHAWLAPLPPP